MSAVVYLLVSTAHLLKSTWRASLARIDAMVDRKVDRSAVPYVGEERRRTPNSE